MIVVDTVPSRVHVLFTKKGKTSVYTRYLTKTHVGFYFWIREHLLYYTYFEGSLVKKKKKDPIPLVCTRTLFVPFTPPANSLLHSNLVPCCKVYICSIRGHTSTRSETNLSPPIPTTFSSTIIQPYSFSGSSLNWYVVLIGLLCNVMKTFFFFGLPPDECASDYIDHGPDRQGYKRLQ